MSVDPLVTRATRLARLRLLRARIETLRRAAGITFKGEQVEALDRIIRDELNGIRRANAHRAAQGSATVDVA